MDEEFELDELALGILEAWVNGEDLDEKTEESIPAEVKADLWERVDNDIVPKKGWWSKLFGRKPGAWKDFREDPRGHGRWHPGTQYRDFREDKRGHGEGNPGRIDPREDPR